MIEKTATEEVFEQHTELFPALTSSIQFLSVLTSQELVPAVLPEDHAEWDGAALLSLVASGSLYVKPKSTAATSIEASNPHGTSHEKPFRKSTSQERLPATKRARMNQHLCVQTTSHQAQPSADQQQPTSHP